MFTEYRRKCKADPREFNLGDVFLWKDAKLPFVFNLGTQEGYWRGRASYDAIEQALTEMKKIADRERIAAIAMPQIGTGYGRLSWKKVKTIIEEVFGDWFNTLYVYEEYLPGK